MVDYVPIDMQIAIVCVFVQAALTFYAVFRMGVVRIRSIRQHNIRLSDIALDSRAYPAEALKHSNNLANQFEFPVLLYVGVMLATVFDASSMPFALACVGFVGSRVWHRMIHVRSNNVIMRFKVFLAGIVLLFLAWIFLALGLLEVI